MSVSSRLWIRCLDAACASATAPFVVALTRGTLAKPSFKSYIAQDAFYLDSFKQAFASAARLCRKDDDGFGADHFSTLEGLIENELKMHAKFALELNIDLAAVRPFPQTLLYTEFLDATAKGQCVANICAATTPCMALYGWLGQRAFTSGLARDDNPYANWIREYASPEFKSSVDRLEMLLDHYADKEKIKLEDLILFYAKAMELEYNFFSAHETPNWNGLAPRLLAIDFDDTISHGDTISHLCRAGLKAQNANDAVYQQLLASYTEKYGAFMSSNVRSSSAMDLPNPPPSKSDSGKFQAMEVEFKQFMQLYTDFEDSMLAAVEQAGVLKGLTPEALRTTADTISLKDGAAATIQYAVANQPQLTSAHVLSVNWSQRFIEEVLLVQGLPSTAVQVSANELQGLGDLRASAGCAGSERTPGEGPVSTGWIERSLTGPDHKVALFRSLLALPGEGCSIYVGDSLGDLSALLAADVGIVLGSSSSLRKVSAAYGVEIRSLDEIIHRGNSNGQVPAFPRGVLYQAESWSHLGFCVFGRRYVNDWLTRWTADVYAGGGTPVSAAIASFAAVGASTAPRVLTVAGSDSGGGAGIQADMKTCDAFNVFSTTAVTGLTAQNTKGVTAVQETSVEMLRAQLDAVLSDIGTDSIKTGMIPSVPLAQEVARAVAKYGVRHLVVDPVMVSTCGSLLMDPSQGRDIVRALFPLATLVTPNIPETEAILTMTMTGMDSLDLAACEGSSSSAAHVAAHVWSIKTIPEMEAAAKCLYQLGPAYVLIKGGHLGIHNVSDAAVNSTRATELVDVLYDGQRFEYIRGPHVTTSNVHGTGCTLSTAIACELARGSTVVQAVHAARRYLTQVLSLSATSAIGRGSHGPMLHMSPVFRSSSPSPSSHTARPSTSVNRPLNPIDLTLYAVTDSSLNEKLGHSMEDAVAAAVAGGATVIQIREKHLNTAAFVDVARRIKAITQRAGVPLIINDRVDVALAVDAEGVHVGQSDMSAAEVRRIIGPHKILGVSTKSSAEVMKAQADGADYVGTGAVYPTNTKVVTRELGVEGLLEVTQTPGLLIPVVAIGGIAGLDRVRACLQEGKASGIAVVSAVFGQNDVRRATSELLAEIKTAMKDT